MYTTITQRESSIIFITTNIVSNTYKNAFPNCYWGGKGEMEDDNKALGAISSEKLYVK